VRDSSVLIVQLRPLLLGTYGDGGNAIVLRERLRRRHIDAAVLELNEGGVPASADLIVIGGGEDDAQALVAADATLARSLRAAVDGGSVVLAVCAGFQLLGAHFADRDGHAVAGFGVIDCTSDQLRSRAVGEALTEASIGDIGTLTGFENHRGRTHLGPGARPLGTVIVGTGNDGSTDGAVAGAVFATYLHGPVLGRNPVLADHLLGHVTGPLEPLDDSDVDQLRAERLAAALARSGASRLRRRLRLRRTRWRQTR